MVLNLFNLAYLNTNTTAPSLKKINDLLYYNCNILKYWEKSGVSETDEKKLVNNLIIYIY